MNNIIQFLHRQLAELEENLRLIQERKAEHVLEIDVPLQLIKNERRLEAQIADLRKRLDLLAQRSLDANDLEVSADTTADAAQQIAWDMKYGLPTQKYLDFVTRYFLQREVEQPLVDPFAMDVPMDKVEDVYVVRRSVEDEIGQLDSRIVLGTEGSGKTTLFRKLATLLPGQTLVVQLPLAQTGTSLPEREMIEGKISPLAPDILVRYIFNAYWKHLLRDHVKRARFLPHLRRCQGWMTTLRRFYSRYLPLHPEIPEEFELMAWLNHQSPEDSDAPENALQELIQFVTFKPEQYGTPLSQPYARIQILVDGTEWLSNLAIIRLLRDAQKLYDLYLDRVQFKLFADPAWQKQIEAIPCVRQGRVMVYSMPKWRAEELRQILLRRLTAWMPGEFADASIQTDYNWSRHIPDTHLKPTAKNQFVKTIVEGALKACEARGDLDAPIHVLRLARGLVAACAGHWEERGYIPPLSLNQIGELAGFYWKEGSVETSSEFSA